MARSSLPKKTKIIVVVVNVAKNLHEIAFKSDLTFVSIYIYEL
jgi:hypothetical protein